MEAIPESTTASPALLMRPIASSILNVVSVLGSVSPIPAFAEEPGTTKPTVVLVHGAFADSSSWNGVISGPPARLIVDAPLPEQLAKGCVVVRYRAENARILPVYGPFALAVAPRIGHLHVTIDDLPWHWLDASGEPLSINGLPPEHHKLLMELEDPNHRVMDSETVTFGIPKSRESSR